LLKVANTPDRLYTSIPNVTVGLPEKSVSISVTLPATSGSLPLYFRSAATSLRKYSLYRVVALTDISGVGVGSGSGVGSGVGVGSGGGVEIGSGVGNGCADSSMISGLSGVIWLVPPDVVEHSDAEAPMMINAPRTHAAAIPAFFFLLISF